MQFATDFADSSDHLSIRADLAGGVTIIVMLVALFRVVRLSTESRTHLRRVTMVYGDARHSFMV